MAWSDAVFIIVFGSGLMVGMFHIMGQVGFIIPPAIGAILGAAMVALGTMGIICRYQREGDPSRGFPVKSPGSGPISPPSVK
ncbi:MAG: hypothetical protein JWN51_2856, partial [Phycisphaerales bacterium]|nr:hypothetical protein [Phycisphaerales bacterium]